MKKILILYAMYGSGHKSAANSIKAYIDENYSDVETKAVDCIQYINKPINAISIKAYNKLTTKFTGLWKKVYYNSNKGFMSKISNGANKLMAKKLNKLFKSYQPDFVISTHMFATQMTGYLKRKGKINCPLATVLTDFEPHGQWLEEHEYGNLFFVARDEMKQKLIDEYHVDAKKINVTGIPVSPKFSKEFNEDEIYKSSELNPDLKTILLFGNAKTGSERKKTLEVLKCLCTYLDKYQIVAVSGKSKKMIKSFDEIKNSLQDSTNLHVYDYINNVPEIMHISSLVITKTGGLTSSESLASSLPVLVINPIPGQEEENAGYLVDAGAAVWLHKNDSVPDVIDSLLNHQEKLNEMGENARKLAHIESTKAICDKIKEEFKF